MNYKKGFNKDSLRKCLIFKEGKWYIKKYKPHWDRLVGPYDTKEEAIDDLLGMLRLIKTLDWQLIIKSSDNK